MDGRRPGEATEDATAEDALLRRAFRARLEEAPPGDHPTVEELADYAEGVLPEDRAEDLRDHLAVCRECAEVVLDLRPAVELEIPEGTADLSEIESAALWRRLDGATSATEDSGLQEPASSRTSEGASPPSPAPAAMGGARSPATGASIDPATRGSVAKTPANRWLAGLAATFLLTTLLLALWSAHLYRQQPVDDADLALATLVPTEGLGVTRGGPQPVPIPDWARRMYLRLGYGGLESHEGYRAELLDSTGQTVWSDPDVRRNPDGTFGVVVERSVLNGERFRLRLYGVEGGEEEPVAEYLLVPEPRGTEAPETRVR